MSVLRRAIAPSAVCKHVSTVSRAQVRRIHPSSVVLKKKKQIGSSSTRADVDDAFPFDPPPEEELFASTAASSSKSSGSFDDSIAHAQLLGGKTVELLRIRSETFESIRTSTLELISQPGRLRQPPRKSTIKRLVALADTKEQLEEATDLMAKWRSATLPQELEPSEFIGRCIALDCPDLALVVLADRPKYGLDIPSLASAHRLMNALSNQPEPEDNTSPGLRDSLVLAELYPLYGLPRASNDALSCTMLAGTIARKVLDAPKAEDGAPAATPIPKDSFDAIMVELKRVVVNWESRDAMRPRKAMNWMRRNVQYIEGAVRREGGAVPTWLEEFSRRLKEGPPEGGSLASS